IRERRRQALAVLVFRDAARSICHRTADVEHHVTIEIGFLFELLDVMAIASSVDLPVDRGEIIAGDVLTVLREFDAEPFEWTAMKARQESFDDGARFQLQVAEARDDRRIEKLAFAHARRHGYIPLFGSGTDSSRRSTIASELIRSDSA